MSEIVSKGRWGVVNNDGVAGKVCDTCDVWFPLDKLPNGIKKGVHYVSGRCRPCELSRQKKWRHEVRDKHRKRLVPRKQEDGMIVCGRCKVAKTSDKFYPSAKSLPYVCKSCQKAYERTWRAENKPARREAKWAERGIELTVEQYDEMFAAQGGCCKGCNTPQEKLPKKLSVDHCHTTGRVRGLLCSPCNLTMGMLEDNANTLRRLADIIEGKL